MHVRAGDVAMVKTSGRDDGGRENVEKEEERDKEKDETETPVDGQLQRRHDLSQVLSKSLFLLTPCRWKIQIKVCLV